MNIEKMNKIASSIDERGIDLNEILIKIGQGHKDPEIQMLAAVTRGLLFARENDLSYQREQRERE